MPVWAQRLAWFVAVVVLGVALGLVARGSLPEREDRGAGGASTVMGASGSARASVDRFTVSVSGDILVHQPVWSNALAAGGGERYDFTPMFEAIRPYVRGADLAICHLETPITSGEPAGYPLFSTPPDLVASIRQSGWDGCSTASNHSLDMGMSGVEQTVAAFRANGLAQSGSYANERQARRPVILDVDGVAIGLLAYTDHTNGIPLPEPWTVGYLPAGEPAREKAARVAADVRRAVGAGADGVLVAIQWGDEYATEPNASQRELAAALVRIPAVIAIAGQGPHVVQPIGRIGGKFVMFSSGNLLSNQSALAGLPADSQNGLIGLLRVATAESDAVSNDGAGDVDDTAQMVNDPAARLAARPGAVVGEDRVIVVTGVDYVPTRVRLSDHQVQPVGRALQTDSESTQALRESWQSTVTIAGQTPHITPIPQNLP